VLRNPLLRTLQSLADENGIHSINKTSMKKYIESALEQHNVMTRSLLCKPNGKLNHDDLERAKDIMQKRCTVAILPDHENTIHSYEKHFDIELSTDMRTCVINQLSESWRKTQNSQVHLIAFQNSELLRQTNSMDMELFLNATQFMYSSKH